MNYLTLKGRQAKIGIYCLFPILIIFILILIIIIKEYNNPQNFEEYYAPFGIGIIVLLLSYSIYSSKSILYFNKYKNYFSEKEKSIDKISSKENLTKDVVIYELETLLEKGYIEGLTIDFKKNEIIYHY